MIDYLRNPFTYVWAFLSAITILSWLIGRPDGGAFETNTTITVGVLVIAAVKAHCVMRYFMEVRMGPAWLKRTTDGWLLVLLLLLLGFYVL